MPIVVPTAMALGMIVGRGHPLCLHHRCSPLKKTGLPVPITAARADRFLSSLLYPLTFVVAEAGAHQR